VELFRQQPAISLQETATHLNLTKDGVRYHINKLKNKGILRRVGTKNGYWEIKNIRSLADSAP
jgi:ATP-dependent DNA helicase RecG